MTALLLLVGITAGAAVTWLLVCRPAAARTADVEARLHAAMAQRDRAQQERDAAQVGSVHAHDQELAALAQMRALHAEVRALADRLDQGAHTLAARQIRQVLAGELGKEVTR